MVAIGAGQKVQGHEGESVPGGTPPPRPAMRGHGIAQDRSTPAVGRAAQDWFKRESSLCALDNPLGNGRGVPRRDSHAVRTERREQANSRPAIRAAGRKAEVGKAEGMSIRRKRSRVMIGGPHPYQ